MFLKQMAGVATAAAIMVGGFLATAPAAGASAANPTQAEIVACVAMAYAPNTPLYDAQWTVTGGAANKNATLGHIADARALLDKIDCVGPVQPAAYVLDDINTLLDSAVASIDKGDYKTAEATLWKAVSAQQYMAFAVLELLY